MLLCQRWENDVSRELDRLEMLASDLASRYGEDDEIVRVVRESFPQKPTATVYPSAIRFKARVAEHATVAPKAAA
jgi:hypothetical protein